MQSEKCPQETVRAIFAGIHTILTAALKQPSLKPAVCSLRGRELLLGSNTSLKLWGVCLTQPSVSRLLYQPQATTTPKRKGFRWLGLGCPFFELAILHRRRGLVSHTLQQLGYYTSNASLLNLGSGLVRIAPIGLVTLA